MQAKDMRKATYVRDAKNRLNTYFVHKSKDIKIPRNIEILLRQHGSIGYALKLQKWVVGEFSGQKDELNDETEYIAHTLATQDSEPVHSYRLKNHEEVIVLRNNALARNDMDIIEWDADMRTETDVSMYYQLVNSRNIPVIVANTDQVKTQIEDVFDKIEAGRPCVITTDLISQIEVKDIIDHDAISKMECLNELNEVLTKRSMNWFGATLDVKDKKAQVSVQELKSYDDYTSIGFLANYEERKLFCEEMKENGIDYEIIRNPIFSDEPTDEEIETGEKMEEDENVEENQVERDLSDKEADTSAINDDK